MGNIKEQECKQRQRLLSERHDARAVRRHLSWGLNGDCLVEGGKHHQPRRGAGGGRACAEQGYSLCPVEATAAGAEGSPLRVHGRDRLPEAWPASPWGAAASAAQASVGKTAAAHNCVL